MIKSLTVVNYRGEKLKITLTEADPAHGLLIKDITGIGPADAILNSSDYASNDGSEFNSARLDKRSIQIVFLLTTEGGITIEQARHNAYRLFQNKKQVKLIFETDTRTISIDGRVEHNQPVIFSDKETVTVDIQCFDPYFYKYSTHGDKETVDLMAVSPAFHFEQDGELETPFEVGIYGYDSGQIIETIDYEGEAENGFIGTIKFVGSIIGDIVLSRYQSTEYFKIDLTKLTAMGLTPANGDEIVFCTEPERNYAKIIQNGIETNILNAVDLAGSTWLLLYPGENTFVYAVTEGSDYTQLSISYKTRYQGV